MTNHTRHELTQVIILVLGIFFVANSDWFITLCTLIGFGTTLGFAYGRTSYGPPELLTLVYEMHLITELLCFFVRGASIGGVCFGGWYQVKD